MGLLDKVSDSVLKKVTKKETVRVNYEQLAEIVKKQFINGADDDFLKKICKTAKGGYCSYTGKDLTSVDKNYLFHVGTRQNNILFLVGGGMEAYVFNKEEKKFYQLDKNRNWKKFYKSIISTVNAEKLNRNK